MLNWIVWNGIVFICIKMGLASNNQQTLVFHKAQTNKHSIALRNYCFRFVFSAFVFKSLNYFFLRCRWCLFWSVFPVQYFLGGWCMLVIFFLPGKFYVDMSESYGSASVFFPFLYFIDTWYQLPAYQNSGSLKLRVVIHWKILQFTLLLYQPTRPSQVTLLICWF